MLSKKEFKEITSLLNKKFRKEKGKFIVEGKKLIHEAINSNFKCELIITTNNFIETHPDFFTLKYIDQIRKGIISQREFKKFTDTETPQGIAAVFFASQGKQEFSSNTIIALENISDPGNLGTIIRNCDWFGFNDIILSENCAEIYNPKVIRASAGSIFHINNKEQINFHSSLNYYRSIGYNIVCADLDGTDIYKFVKPNKFIIVFCNEANGPSIELLKTCDEKITIPKYGNAESLNVASASAVILSVLSK